MRVRVRHIGLVIGTFLLGSGCGPDRPRAEEASAKLSDTDVAQIRAADSLFLAAANAGNLDGLSAVYAENAQLLPPNLPPQKGRDAIRKFWGGFLNTYSVRFEIDSDMIDGRNDLAYNVGHYRLRAVPKEKNGAGIADEGKFVEILQRQADGSWKYIVDMYSSNLAAPH